MNRTKMAKQYGLMAVNLIASALSWSAALYMRFYKTTGEDIKTHWKALLIILLVACIYSLCTHEEKTFLRRSAKVEFLCVIKMETIVTLLSVFLIYLLGWTYVLSRGVVVNFIWISFLLSIIGRLLFKKFFIRHVSSDKNCVRLLVVTPHDKIDAIVKRLHEKLGPEYTIVGCASIDEVSAEIKKPKDVTGMLTQIAFDEVFIYAPDTPQEKVYELIDGFEKMGVLCHYSLNAPTARTEIFGGCAAVVYGKEGPAAWQLFIKRLLDILGGLVGCIITLFLLIIIGPMIKADSPGPIFFSQTRIGRNGRRFKIWKFRSMYIDAEERKKDLESQNEMTGYMFKVENDPRITKIGAFLRKTSLDEFPQFWNVLKGDMSLVGTRPPTEDEFSKYNEHYRRRLSMTPGLTGMWQVSGRSDINDFDEVVKLDLYYIDHWSIRMDIGILFKTVGVLFTGKGAK